MIPHFNGHLFDLPIFDIPIHGSACWWRSA